MGCELGNTQDKVDLELSDIKSQEISKSNP